MFFHFARFKSEIQFRGVLLGKNRKLLTIAQLFNTLPRTYNYEKNIGKKSASNTLVNKYSTQHDGKNSKENSWTSVKNTLAAFGIVFASITGYVVYKLGAPLVGEDGEIIKDEFSHLSFWQQYVHRTLKELNDYKRMIKEPSRDKLLPDVMTYPYYQPPYTLIIELTDVLVHPEWTYQTGWRFKKRPGLDYFLEHLHGLYEIVIFTAEQGMTVFPIMDALDPKGHVSYKLVRDATHFVDGVHVKDLSKLNRDLSKVIVIDWNLDAVKFHQENVFGIPRWHGVDNDTTLFDLTSFLKTVAQMEVEDVRNVLKYYKEFDNPLHTFRKKQLELLEQMEEEKNKKSNKTFFKL